MKILYVTTIGMTMTFFKDLIKVLMDQGHVVDIICNEEEFSVPSCYRDWGCRIFHHNCARNPLSPGNLKAISQIRKLVCANEYDIVHCHTPVAAMCTRLACIGARKRGTKVFYTAHGFHFFKGSPMKNWLLYYPVEWMCSFWTDLIITINQEDYQLAEKFHARAREYVPGVGFELKRFADVTVDRRQMRTSLGIPEDAFLLASVGEVNANKNHEVILRAMAALKDPAVYFMIAGEGTRRECLEQLAESLGIQSQVHLLGQREDVPQLYAAADACCFPSIREGLGLAALEGMASGLPLICADNRGTRSYACHEENALVCPWNDPMAFARAIETLRNDPQKRIAFGEQGREMAKNFSVEQIVSVMKDIYEKYSDTVPQ